MSKTNDKDSKDADQKERAEEVGKKVTEQEPAVISANDLTINPKARGQ